MKDYFAEEIGNVAVQDAPKDYFAEEVAKPMFSTVEEAQKANAKAQGEQALLAREAQHPYQTAIAKTGEQFPLYFNKALNTATANIPEIIANKLGGTLNPSQKELANNPIAAGTADAIGFMAPGGAPMRAIQAAEVVTNPLTRAVIQGAGAMATQLPTKDRSVDEYNAGIATGGVFGAAGRGVEKVAHGAIQEGAKATAGRIHDYLVKLPVGSFKFGKNPIKVAADEGIIANNMAEYEQMAAARLKERSAQLEGAIQNSDKTINISDMVNNHLDEAKRKLAGSLKDRTSAIDELNTVRENLNAQYGDLTSVPVQDALKLKRQLADDFPFTQESKGDITTKATHKIYHDINSAVEQAHPEIAELNERVSGLIDIKNAARNRNAVESRNNPLGLMARLGAAGSFVGGSAMGHSAEGVIGALGIIGFEKAIQSPVVLTRVAKALSMMSMDDKSKVFAAFPKLKASVIKVDPRDVEIMAGKDYPVARTPIRTKAEFAQQAALEGPAGAEGLPAPVQRMGLPNLSAEGRYNSFREKPIITPATGAGESVIPMRESFTPERMPINDLEKHIQNRYELGASQKELDALETLYAKRVAGEPVSYTPIPSNKSLPKDSPEVVKSLLKETKKQPEGDVRGQIIRSRNSAYNQQSDTGSAGAVRPNPSGSTQIPRKVEQAPGQGATTQAGEPGKTSTVIPSKKLLGSIGAITGGIAMSSNADASTNKIIQKQEGGKQVRKGTLISNRGIERPTINEFNKATGKNYDINKLNQSQTDEIYNWYFKGFKVPETGHPAFDTIVKDAAFHWGKNGALKMVQSVIGVTPDGKWGKKSEAAFDEWINSKSLEEAAREITNKQRRYMKTRPNYEQNKNGWKNRLKKMERLLTEV